MKRPSPALAVSILSLFVALGGTSYAVTQLPRNSIGTAQLKKNAVTGAKVMDGSLSGTDIDVSTLGTVPAAASATTAGTATRAETAGRADSAASADTATTAGSATTATSATNATNAQTLGGKTAAELLQESKVHCPAGMKLAAGACLDEQPSAAAPLYLAFQTCGEENFRLPTEGELLAYANQYVDSSILEWVEPEIVAEGGFKGLVIGATRVNGEIEYSAYYYETSVSRAYRCATAASN